MDLANEQQAHVFERARDARCLDDCEDEAILAAVLEYIQREEERARQRAPTGAPHCKRKAPEPSNPELSGLKKWRLGHEKSEWWQVLKDPRTYDESSRKARKFRLRFRVPRVIFDKLLEQVEEAVDEDGNSIFGPKGPCAPPIPLSMLLLSVLRYLALGCPWDLIEELARVCETKLKTFYKTFTKWFLKTKYEGLVCIGDWRKNIEPTFNRVGFPGCCGSMDAVHLGWEKCPHSQVGLHVGKEGFPTIAFNCVSDHNGRVIHVTSGHPGARNDKTIVRHDNFIMTLRTEPEFTQFKYKVIGPEGYEDEVTGAYVIADGGYHKWKETQCGVKYCGDHNLNSYSERLESVRKDIECVFGRLKRRFRILKLPFMCRTAQGIEDTFKLCCALHNMLLDHDGLSDIGWLDTDCVDRIGYSRARLSCTLEGNFCTQPTFCTFRSRH